MLIDSRAIRNHILPKAVERIGLLYRQKEHLYPPITILRDQIAYRGGIINIKIGPI